MLSFLFSTQHKVTLIVCHSVLYKLIQIYTNIDGGYKGMELVNAVEAEHRNHLCAWRFHHGIAFAFGDFKLKSPSTKVIPR